MTKRSPFRYSKTSPEFIRFAAIMCVRFRPSLWNVENFLHERGIEVSHETVRFWRNRFGPIFAAEIRRNRVSRKRSVSNWQRHLDEVFVKINDQAHYQWRAVDRESEVPKSYVTKRRDRKAALKILRRSMKRYGRAEIIVTDKLRGYGAAMKVIGSAERQEAGRWRNNRAENFHLSFRRQERACSGFGKCDVYRNCPTFILPSRTLQSRARPILTR